uniref:Protein wntless homolog n=1 Tax=Steinernema glaseri TaxID=37863 RepID=A0A1I8ACZ7_9BILA
MPANGGAVIEHLSNRKLSVILGLLLCLQIGFFSIGAILAPAPSSSMEFLMTKCSDRNAGRSDEWFQIQPQSKQCQIIEDLNHYTSVPNAFARDIVFVAQMPHRREAIQLQYSPWFQFLLGLLEIEIEYHSGFEQVTNSPLTLDVRMGYQTKVDGPWNEFIATNATRQLDCTIPEDRKSDGQLYQCSVMDLFELGANNYPTYLLNIRIPVDFKECQRKDPAARNCHVPKINEMRVIAIHQNGGFTKVWLWMKTVIAPFIVAATVWYYKRVSALNRPRYLVENSILALGISLAILDFPIEWMSLWFRLPCMLLIADIRQGLFYAVLFSFWLIFAGEHLNDGNASGTLKNYWRNLVFITISSVSLLIYDICERGMQLNNPFYSIWSSDTGTNLALATIYIASISAICYFSFLVYKIWMVWTHIKGKCAQLAQKNEAQRLKEKNLIYRFKFLMVFTLVCAGLTILSYILKQYGEGQMHGDDPDESVLTHSTSSFFTGTFGMWNIYVLLLLAMYAPSHKNYGHARFGETDDLMTGETESSAMTTFVKPATD